MSTVCFSSVLLTLVCSDALLKICQLLDVPNYTFYKGLGPYLHFTGSLEKILTQEVAPVTWCEGAEESCSARQGGLGAQGDGRAVGQCPHPQGWSPTLPEQLWWHYTGSEDNPLLARQVFRDVTDQRQPRDWDQGIWLRKEHGQTTEQQHGSGRTMGESIRGCLQGGSQQPSLTELLAQQPHSWLQVQEAVLTMAQAAQVLTAGKNCAQGSDNWSSGGLTKRVCLSERVASRFKRGQNCFKCLIHSKPDLSVKLALTNLE